MSAALAAPSSPQGDASEFDGKRARSRTRSEVTTKTELKLTAKADTHVSRRLKRQHHREIWKARFSPPGGGGAFIPKKMPFYATT